MMKSQHINSPFARALRQQSALAHKADAALCARLWKMQRHGSDQARENFLKVRAGMQS